MTEIDRMKFKKLQQEVKKLQQEHTKSQLHIVNLENSFDWLKKEVQSGMADVMHRFLNDNVEIGIVQRSVEEQIADLIPRD